MLTLKNITKLIVIKNEKGNQRLNKKTELHKTRVTRVKKLCDMSKSKRSILNCSSTSKKKEFIKTIN